MCAVQVRSSEMFTDVSPSVPPLPSEAAHPLHRGPTDPNYCINAAWRGGNQPVTLLRCNGSPGCFDSCLQFISIVGLVSLIFLFTIPHKFSMGFRSGEFAGQSSTVTPWSLNQLLVPLAVWAGTSPAGKLNQHLHKACQQKEA